MKSHQIALFILIAFLVGAVGVAAYLYGQNKALNSGNPENSTRAQVVLSPAITQAVVTMQPGVSLAVTPTGAQTATVTIESEDNLPAQDVSELKTRNINPFVDWQKDQGNDQAVASIKITSNNSASYPYKFEYTLAGGGYGGYLVLRKDGHLGWFLPECLNTCQFSDSFKAKYPEIISQTN